MNTPSSRPGRVLVLLSGLIALPLAAAPRVVLNEIMYHPPGDADTLQFVELHNAGTTGADLAGWQFTDGIEFRFPAGATLAPGAFLVVAKDPAAVAAAYPTAGPVMGPFGGRLKHGGERLRLADAEGTVIDSVRFGDRSPWPLGPDGLGASLERICPAAPGDDAANWAGSRLPEVRVAGGTPGAANDAGSARPLPVVSAIDAAREESGRSLRVRVGAVAADGGAVDGWVRWETVTPDGTVTPGREVPLTRSDSGLSATWELPAGPAVVRYQVRVRDAAGAERRVPADHDPRPRFSVAAGPSGAEVTEASIPRWHLIQFGPDEEQGPSLRHRSRRGASAPPPSHGNALLVRTPAGGGEAEVFDFIRVTPRHGGWKVRMLPDRPLDGLDTLNVIFEDRPRFVLAEHLGYELFHRAGVAAPLSGHARVIFNQRDRGYHLWVEQPNRDFLKRVDLDPDGSLYKLLWYGNGLVGQHEAKTPAAAGHADLKAIVGLIQDKDSRRRGEAISGHIDVGNFAGYYAVGMCLQNWDGFFNNHCLHHDRRPGGRWTIIPWDLDKTWGDYDGASAAYDWTAMPLSFGRAGDTAPRTGGGGGVLLSLLGFGGGAQGPWGGPPWWRPGGWFSSPLLADPEFRKAFLARLDTLCREVFTEAAFGPVIDDLARRLRPEVLHRARVMGLDPDREADRFDRHIESFRFQLRERGRFLRAELDREMAPQ